MFSGDFSVGPRAEIHKIAAGEWQILREVKLRALQESPDVFEERLADVVTWDAARWVRHASPARNEFKQVLVVSVDSRHEGMIYVATDKLSSATGYLGSLWVSPYIRGCSIGRELLNAALTQIVHWDLDRARLCVAEQDVGAISLYLRAGFTKTGVSKSLPSGITVLEMHRTL
ncbi:GNAT family N-acetyltransferase [Nocardia brasiliensis]|uniref:Putative acetyltransferase n=1 Tax=Nocardia brasiliensis (strain ATCC 700358 / HUJEG-1) TaxID=1133849 RepID=K0F001_NOCB7|nr:GNAT family N-acetyltransferase [Nocardia brasiliensis]AFU02669.1 putative acetyltransferase [Nocardia brasiliensis ATCC 700358]